MKNRATPKPAPFTPVIKKTMTEEIVTTTPDEEVILTPESPEITEEVIEELTTPIIEVVDPALEQAALAPQQFPVKQAIYQNYYGV